MRAGFRRAYNGVQVDPQKFLHQFRKAHRLPIHTWSDMFHVEERVVNHHAARVVKSAMRTAALEGAGFGLGRDADDITGRGNSFGDYDTHVAEVEPDLRIRV